jgi:hypothetical protein
MKVEQTVPSLLLFPFPFIKHRLISPVAFPPQKQAKVSSRLTLVVGGEKQTFTTFHLRFHLTRDFLCIDKVCAPLLPSLRNWNKQLAELHA